MAKKLIIAAAAMVAVAVQAMPTEDEIAKVTPVVQELAKGDYADLKAGRKSPEQVAETLIGYVKDAESEAAKYVLIGKAFDLYLEHGPLSKARDVANEMLPSHVRRCNLSVFNERLGCALAAKDQWDYAFMAFKRCGGKMAEIVAWEKAYPETGITELTTGAVGDFWWELSEKYADSPKVAAALRAHAVRWLKEAIKNNSLRGLRRTLATKRIAEAEKEIGSVPLQAPLPSSRTPRDNGTSQKVAENQSDVQVKPSATADKLMNAEDVLPHLKVSKPAGRPITLNFGKGAKIEFIGCPAGEFMMGHNNPSGGRPSMRACMFYHTVKITRPFWLAKYRTTHEMWSAYQKVKLTEVDKALGGMRCAHLARADDIIDFCDWVTKKCRRSLPPGYIVRLPTDAEWEYAYKAGMTDPEDIYAKACKDWNGTFGGSREYARIAVLFEAEIVPKLQGAGIKYDRDTTDICIPVGTKQPNAWGFYDMLGIGGEIMLDCFDSKLLGPERRWENVLRYEDVETDPLRYFSDPSKVATYMRRGGSRVEIASMCFRFSTIWMGLGHSFRLCIGPDLLKEKRIKKRTGRGVNGNKDSAYPGSQPKRK